MNLYREEGFSLVELLVVILVLGILTAIALPSFLDERRKGQDAATKSNVRNLVFEMSSCFQIEDGFTTCPGTLVGSGLPIGPGPGEVRIVTATDDSFELEGLSMARTSAGVSHQFRLVYDVATGTRRQCLPVGQGGCGPDDDGDGFGDW